MADGPALNDLSSCVDAGTRIQHRLPGCNWKADMRALLVTILLMAAGRSWAFNVDSYHTGMSVEEARQVALTSGGAKWQAVQSNSGSASQFLVFDYANTIIGSLIFCKGQLHFYSKNLPGGFSVFSRLLERQTEALGPGFYVMQNEDTNLGELHVLSFVWSLGTEEARISLTKIAAQSEDVGLSWGERGACR